MGFLLCSAHQTTGVWGVGGGSPARALLPVMRHSFLALAKECKPKTEAGAYSVDMAEMFMNVYNC